MILDEPSTINGWLAKPGPINLRRTHHVARHVQRAPDLDAARGIITWAVIGAGIYAWGYLFVWALTR